MATVTVRSTERSTTDRYWSILIVVAVVIWIVAGPRVSYRESDCKIIPDDGRAANGTSRFVRNETDCNTVPVTQSVRQRLLIYINGVWTDWHDYQIICGRDLWNGNHGRSVLIAIWANVLVCACIIVYAVASMQANSEIVFEIAMSIYVLFSMIFLSRFMILVNYMTLHPNSRVTFKDQLLLWIMPEIVLLTILCTRVSVSWPGRARDDRGRAVDTPERARDNQSRAVDMPKRARDDQSRAVDTFERPKVQFLNFIYPLIWLVITLILYETIFESAYKLEWVNRWSCVVATSLVCYGLLAIYHFLKMVLSCLVDLTLTGNTLGRNAFKALYLVCRYHLGTACYRATLIFPRIHATIVVNEQASIERLQLSAARRFYLTHWHIYNLSTTVSGARGYNHSESIRETWRFFVKHPDKLHNFQIFKHLHKYFFIILMMTNNLMFIFLWIHGAIIDPRFPTGTWVAYIIGYFLSLILLNWLDTVFDVIRFQEANKTIFTELL